MLCNNQEAQHVRVDSTDQGTRQHGRESKARTGFGFQLSHVLTLEPAGIKFTKFSPTDIYRTSSCTAL